jgi:hypothetical protein
MEFLYFSDLNRATAARARPISCGDHGDDMDDMVMGKVIRAGCLRVNLSAVNDVG